MSDNLYPELTEVGKIEADKAMNAFREALKKTADEAIDSIHCQVLPHIETDSWTNYRQSLLSGLCGYTDTDGIDGQSWKSIRALILKEHREEIIGDLDHDNIDKIADLERSLELARMF